jgi:hypothetical protein
VVALVLAVRPMSEKTDDAAAMARAARDLAATSDLSVPYALGVIAEAARLLEAADLVRDLADGSPIVFTSGGDWHACGLCDASLPVEPDDHDPACPWRRAVDWVRDQEAKT